MWEERIQTEMRFDDIKKRMNSGICLSLFGLRIVIIQSGCLLMFNFKTDRTPVSIETLLRPGLLGCNSRRGAVVGIFLLATTSRPFLGPNQPVSGSLTRRVKRQGCEGDHSLPSSAKAKKSRMRGAIHPLPQYLFMAWYLVKHRRNFTFTFTFSCAWASVSVCHFGVRT
jgi:hypothetical protein